MDRGTRWSYSSGGSQRVRHDWATNTSFSLCSLLGRFSWNAYFVNINFHRYFYWALTMNEWWALLPFPIKLVSCLEGSRKRREGNSEEERNLFVWNEWSYFYCSFCNWIWRSFFLITHYFQRKWRRGRGIHQSLCSKKKCHNPITLSILTLTGRKRYPSYSFYYLSLCPHPILLHFLLW